MNAMFSSTAVPSCKSASGSVWSSDTYKIVEIKLTDSFLWSKNLYSSKYTTLISSVAASLTSADEDSLGARSLDNFHSACRSWMTFLNKDNSSVVGAELNTRYEQDLARYLIHLKDSGLSDSTIRDRKSFVKKLYVTYQTQRAIASDGRSTELGIELGRLLQKADYGYKILSEKSGVSASFIQRLLAGINPRKDAFSKVKRMEHALMVDKVITQAGHLTDLLTLSKNFVKKFDSDNSVLDLVPDPSLPKFSSISNKPLSKISVDDLKIRFPNIWSFLDDYRIQKVESGSWVLHALDRKSRSDSSTWCFQHDGDIVYSPTYQIYLSCLCSYLSYCSQYRNMKDSSIDCLNIVFDRKLLILFLRFMRDRREGSLGSVGRALRTLINELTKEATRQIKDGAISTFPAFNDFEKLLSDISNLTSNDKSGAIRDPMARLKAFFELADPIAPVAQLSRKLCESAKLPHTFISDAIAVRDSFLLAFLTVVPLRERTITNLIYLDNNTGHFKYSESERCWRLDIPAKLVKNARRISRYFPRSMNSLIEKYLFEARPRLLQTFPAHLSIDWLFVSKYRSENLRSIVDDEGEKFDIEPGQLAVSHRLAAVTERAWGVALRVHSFRHLLATRFLKLNPGEFQACADLLADSVETVMKHYAYHDTRWTEDILNRSIEKVFDWT